MRKALTIIPMHGEVYAVVYSDRLAPIQFRGSLDECLAYRGFKG
jgi:hypothetical protein